MRAAYTREVEEDTLGPVNEKDSEFHITDLQHEACLGLDLERIKQFSDGSVRIYVSCTSAPGTALAIWPHWNVLTDGTLVAARNHAGWKYRGRTQRISLEQLRQYAHHQKAVQRSSHHLAL